MPQSIPEDFTTFLKYAEVRAFSAGFKPQSLNPEAVKVVGK
jgi:hypothetical protein